jgi:predicted nucleic acid-binding Zn ribbon protein
MKQCPFCREEIHDDAIKCKNCREMIDNKENKVKIFFAYFYGVLGGILLSVKIKDMLQFLINNSSLFFWCIGWSAIGIAFGLWNDRKGGRKNIEHYVFYFLFVLIFGSLVALIFSSFWSGGEHPYSVSFLVAFTIGFTGDKLAGKVIEIMKK